MLLLLILDFITKKKKKQLIVYMIRGMRIIERTLTLCNIWNTSISKAIYYVIDKIRNIIIIPFVQNIYVA